jgi:hypothetical protein
MGCELVERRKIGLASPLRGNYPETTAPPQAVSARGPSDGNEKRHDCNILQRINSNLAKNSRPQRLAGFDYTGLPDNSNELLSASAVVPPS